MPVMLLPFFPLVTVLMSMVFLATVKCAEGECADIVQDVADCDVCWCYEEGGFGCFCCTVCHDDDDHDDPNTYYDDSSHLFHSYAKKS